MNRKIIRKILSTTLIVVLVFFSFVSTVNAKKCTNLIRNTFRMTGLPSSILETSTIAPLSVSLENLTANSKYTIACHSKSCGLCKFKEVSSSKKIVLANSSGKATWNISNNDCWTDQNKFKVVIKPSIGSESCDAGSVIKMGAVEKSALIADFYLKNGSRESACFEDGQTISWGFKLEDGEGNNLAAGTKIYVGTEVTEYGTYTPERTFTVDSDGWVKGSDVLDNVSPDGSGIRSIGTSMLGNDISYKVKYISSIDNSASREIGEVSGAVVLAQCTEDDINAGLDNSSAEAYDICESNLAQNSTALGNCTSCYGSGGIWTAVGCIEQDPQSMVSKLMNIGIGLLGGVFLLRVLAASFMLTTSQGDVKKTTEAKSMITEAIIGMIFIIFSVTILQFIGSDVMQLPGFGG